jgi:DeoR/GlpR family transcriptional regulator of sugar metabolism
VRGVTPAGHLTDPDPLESEVKRAMVRRAQRATLLVDGSKFGRAALTQIATLDDVAVVLAADVPDDRLEPVERAGVDVRRV